MDVIRVEHIGKKYLLRHQRNDSYVALRDVLMESFTRVGRSLFRSGPELPGSADREDFWALDDISFRVGQGEKIGIIGRNGAGKSTLLKILSRIVEPTAGRVGIKGRIASLLEVGTGFHPELTARENIYLNGSILGMSRSEIARKFDEIVAFAEVDKFLDTPVKRFSSGMYVRLAFAVAAHLEPEILLIDEVLAVGDALFQKKCIGKMEEVSAREGKTIFFVSHNMQAIRQFCQRCLLLHGGRLLADADTDAVVRQYLQNNSVGDGNDIQLAIARLPVDPVFRLLNVRVLQRGESISRVENGEDLAIEITYRLTERTIGFRIFFDLYDRDENLLFRTFHDDCAGTIQSVPAGTYVSRGIIPANLLSPVMYEIRVLATIFDVRMCIPYPGIRIPIDVERTGIVNRAYLAEPIRGKLAPVINWNTTILD